MDPGMYVAKDWSLISTRRLVLTLFDPGVKRLAVGEADNHKLVTPGFSYIHGVPCLRGQ
jgi:hypothetical protein